MKKMVRLGFTSPKAEYCSGIKIFCVRWSKIKIYKFYIPCHCQHKILDTAIKQAYTHLFFFMQIVRESIIPTQHDVLIF